MPTPPKPGPDTIIPERAPVLGVALRYFIMGAVFLLALLLTAIWQAPLLTADYLHNPATLAVTHLFTLGFGASVVTGAVYQLTPVLLYGHLRSEKLANVHLGLHGLGVILMVYGFLEFATLPIIIGGTCVLTGALLFLGNVAATFVKVERWNWHGYIMGGAIVFYLSTLGWGITMALNQHYGFLGEVEGAPLSAHLTLGLLGWFSLMIVGVGLKLIPMFAPSKPLPPWFVAGVGAGFGAGVLSMLAGLYLWAPLLWLGTALTAAALLAYGGGIWYAWKTRRPGPLDFSIRFGLTAVFAVLPALAIPFAGRQARAGLVFLFAMGFIGGTIVGMLLRIIPFMVWLHRFRNRTHKLEKIPFLHEMFHPRLGWVAYLAWFPAIVLMALGIALAVPGLIVTGAVFGIVSLAGFGGAVGQVIRHIPPGTPALYPGKKA